MLLIYSFYLAFEGHYACLCLNKIICLYSVCISWVGHWNGGVKNSHEFLEEVGQLHSLSEAHPEDSLDHPHATLETLLPFLPTKNQVGPDQNEPHISLADA